MQHHRVVGAVGGVRMRRPVARMQVQLHVAGQLLIPEAQPGAAKIRAAQQIPPAGMQHAQRPVVRRRGLRRIILAPQPDFLEQSFAEGERTVEALDFRHLPVLPRLPPCRHVRASGRTAKRETEKDQS